jgi:hypothetical protein
VVGLDAANEMRAHGADFENQLIQFFGELGEVGVDFFPHTHEGFEG